MLADKNVFLTKLCRGAPFSSLDPESPAGVQTLLVTTAWSASMWRGGHPALGEPPPQSAGGVLQPGTPCLCIVAFADVTFPGVHVDLWGAPATLSIHCHERLTLLRGREESVGCGVSTLADGGAQLVP